MFWRIESCMIRTFLTDLSPVELNSYSFMINLGKCNGSFNAAGDLNLQKYVFRVKPDLNVKIFNMITKINEVNTSL